MNTERKNKLAMLREVYLRAEMKSTKEKYETDHHFRTVVDRGVKAIIERCEKESMDNVQTGTNEIQEPKNHHDLAEIGNLRSYLEGLRDISEDQARELANLSDHTISDYRNVAESAPVCEMGMADWESFQLPLGIYFREIVSLSEDLAKPWAGAALLFQRNTNGLRLLLQSAPDNLALAVSIDSNREITLDNFRGAATIPYDVGEIGQLRIGIFPFRTD